jgi:hypothetical protein
MEDKKQDVNSLEELSKAADALQKGAVDFVDRLAKVLADIQTSKKAEGTWEMKCPYEYGDEVCILDSDGEIISSYWDCRRGSFDIFNQGNIFPTGQASELESKRRKLLTRFRAFRDEYNGDWKPDWKNHRDRKYFISFSEKIKLLLFYTGTSNHFQLFGFFKNEEDAQRAIELFGDEIIELFVEGE